MDESVAGVAVRLRDARGNEAHERSVVDSEIMLHYDMWNKRAILVDSS